MYNALSSKVAFDNLEDSLSGQLGVHPVAADGVTATCNAAAWNTTGAWAEVVPPSTITADFWLESIVIEEVNAADSFLFQVAVGAAASEVIIAAARGVFGHATNCGTLIIPIRKKVAKNARIAVRASCKSTNARTAVVSISYRNVS